MCICMYICMYAYIYVCVVACKMYVCLKPRQNIEKILHLPGKLTMPSSHSYNSVYMFHIRVNTHTQKLSTIHIYVSRDHVDNKTHK